MVTWEKRLKLPELALEVENAVTNIENTYNTTSNWQTTQLPAEAQGLQVPNKVP